MKYFDREKNRLVFFNEKATAQYWDRHWESDDFENIVKSGKRNREVLAVTKKFLDPPAGQKILEGGCGRGQIVYALRELGYDAYGVDYAADTVGKTNEKFPELKISLGDVTKLDFSDGFFDAYWSLGVIEHFWDGYGEIASEMARVLKKDGFLFLTFPQLSPLRKLKAKLGAYPNMADCKMRPEDFYQFGLDWKSVENNFRKHGFRLIGKKSRDGIKGLKGEVKILGSALQKIYNGKSLPAKAAKLAISKAFAPLAGHSKLLIFQKTK